MPLVVVTPPARDHYENETYEESEKQSERIDSASPTSSFNDTPSSATASASDEETSEYRMRVIAAFWTYLRSRVPNSSMETDPEMDREAGVRGHAISDQKRETRDSSGAPRIDM